MQYVSYHNYQNVLNSGNDHQNINLALSMVNNVYHNFIPGTWSNNYKFSSFSTCPLLQYNGSDYEVAKVKRYTVNRGAIRFPLNYAVDETYINNSEGYPAVLSREYLNAIMPYQKNKSCLMSPESEARGDMIELRGAAGGYQARLDWLRTPQNCDQGLVPAWTKVNNNNVWEWQRTGVKEKAANVTGLGTQLDPLHSRFFADYTNASYNYNIQSEVDDTANNVYVFATAVTKLQGAGGSKQIVAVN